MLNCCRCSSLLSLPSVYTLCVPPTCKIGLAFAFLDLPTILEAAHCRAGELDLTGEQSVDPQHEPPSARVFRCP